MKINKEKIRKRLEKSLKNNKKNIEECKQFWFGYLTALSESSILKNEDYRELRDFVCFYNGKLTRKIEKRKKP